MELVLRAIVEGVISGTLVGMAAIGLTLVWGIQKASNVGHSEFLTVGGFLAFAGVVAGLPLVVAGGFALLGMAVVGPLSYLAVFRPMRTAPRVAIVISSVGLGLVLRGVVGMIFGGDLRTYGIPPMRAWQFGPIQVTPLDIIIVAMGAGVAIILGGILYRTRFGLELRAIADLPDLAKVVGVSSDRVNVGLWILASTSAGLAGILLGAKNGLTVFMGFNLIVPAYAAAVLGTVGNPFGALLGGVALGVSAELVSLILTPGIKGAVAFVVLAALLVFRPRGFFYRA